MAGTVMRSTQFRSIVEPILNQAFDGVYDQRKDEYKVIFSEEEGIKRAYHEEPVLFGFGAAPVLPDGQPVTYDEGGELYVKRYTYDVYGLAFALTRVLVEDGDHIRVGSTYSKHLAQAMDEPALKRLMAVQREAGELGQAPAPGMAVPGGTEG